MPAEGGINMRMLFSDIKMDPKTSLVNGFKASGTHTYTRNGVSCTVLTAVVLFALSPYSTNQRNSVRFYLLHRNYTRQQGDISSDDRLIACCYVLASLSWP